MSYENPIGHLAGRRRHEPGLVVDYADVLAQAVINEREKVLRELLDEVSAMPVRANASYEYGPAATEEFKKKALEAIQRKRA